MKTIRIFLLLISLVACWIFPVQAKEETIRVAIIQNVASLNIKLSGPYEVADPQGKQVLYSGRNLMTTVTIDKNGILLGEESFNRDKILLMPKSDAVVIINDRTFRGSILIIKGDRGLLTAVNRIGLEDYVRGILYHEVSHYWPMEALKAQAIVSRTYAVHCMQINKDKDFDLTNDIYSQVYGGSRSERFRTNQAVDETTGKAIFFEGRIIPAYFHATCGGHTEDASLLWNVNIAPLKGVPCGFCKGSPHFAWHEVVFTGEIRQLLVNAGYKTGVIKKIFPLSRDASGRIKDLKIINTKKDLIIPAKDFRSAVGPNLIRSTNFTVNIIGTDAVFEGFGWGHGVGLCQWGAYFMAKNGSTAEEIIDYYYPKSNVGTL